MSPPDMLILAAPKASGGAIASGVVVVIMVAVTAYVAHLKGRFLLYSLLMMVLGALVVGMGGKAGDAMRAIVRFVDQVPYYIAGLFK